MKECRECGGQVTEDFARVFGDNENRVHACQHCRGSLSGAAADAAGVEAAGSKAPTRYPGVSD